MLNLHLPRNQKEEEISLREGASHRSLCLLFIHIKNKKSSMTNWGYKKLKPELHYSIF
jgi:hypothetical protein